MFDQACIECPNIRYVRIGAPGWSRNEHSPRSLRSSSVSRTRTRFGDVLLLARSGCAWSGALGGCAWPVFWNSAAVPPGVTRLNWNTPPLDTLHAMSVPCITLQFVGPAVVVPPLKLPFLIRSVSVAASGLMVKAGLVAGASAGVLLATSV